MTIHGPIPWHFRGRMAYAVVALLVAASLGYAAGERSSDQRFLDGLRHRRLFELARAYCVDRLDDSSLPESRRAELTIELSLSLAEWALNSPPDQREPLWREAWQVTEDFLRQQPDSPWAVLVRLQAGLGVLARGELARQEAEVVADNAPLLEEAQTWLREAIRIFQELDDRLAAAIRQRSSPAGAPVAPRAPEPLSTSELVSVQTNVQYELARALRNQGQSYPAESPDRANSLTRAIRLLDPLARLDNEHPLAWKSRIDEVVCLRLLGDCAAAHHKLAALLAGNPPAEMLLRGRAEKIRLALAERQPDGALAVVDQGREIGGITSGDLDYAWVEAYLAAWRAAVDANDEASAARWQAKAAEMVQSIEREQGPYWTRRAELLLARYIRIAPGGGDLDVLVRAAVSSYRSGRLDDALAAYDRAQAAAEAKGDRRQAFDLGYVAATIEHERNRHAEALQRYRRLAMGMPSHPKAAESHLLAVYHAAELARQQGGPLDPYVELLKEHLQTWPETAGADQVRWRLGQLREYQHDWQGALAVYREISPDSTRFAEAVQAAGRCYRAWLDQRCADGQPTGEITSEAAAWFESLVLGPDNRLPERWSPVARTAALEAARMRLGGGATEAAAAERLVAAALQGAADAPPEWTAAARSVLVLALAAQGRRREAMTVIEQISAEPPKQWLDLLAELSHLAAAAPPELRADLAELQLAALERLPGSRDGLTPAESRAIDFARATALADAGHTREATDAFERLARAYPRDGEIQEAYARLLSAGQDRASLEKALDQWRNVEARTAPRSDRWFRAKYHVAELQYRLGNKEQAAKMIRLLAVLHPDLGGPELKRRFLELLARTAE